MRSHVIPAACAFVLALSAAVHAQTERWDKDIGKEAPKLFPAGWVGTPVSLDALKSAGPAAETEGAGNATVAAGPDTGGNTVVLAFWNADIPC